MHIFRLAKQAEVKLQEPNLVFHNNVQKVVAILRAKGVLSTARCGLNGKVHHLFAAMIVTAHQENTSIDVTSRRQGDLHEQGITTKAYEWLDELVRLGLLVPAQPSLIAHGKLIFGGLFKAYLEEEAEVSDTPKVLERWNVDQKNPTPA